MLLGKSVKRSGGGEGSEAGGAGGGPRGRGPPVVEPLQADADRDRHVLESHLRQRPVARLVRAQSISLKHKEFVEAARSIGATNRMIIFRHLLPNTMAPIVVAATLGIPRAILYEAGISFLGIGVIPPMPSWGLMISEAIPNLRSYPHMLISPAVALSLTVLAFNFLGDGLRDALDPRMQR